jgi:hypothetical protein
VKGSDVNKKNLPDHDARRKNPPRKRQQQQQQQQKQSEKVIPVKNNNTTQNKHTSVNTEHTPREECAQSTNERAINRQGENPNTQPHEVDSDTRL